MTGNEITDEVNEVLVAKGQSKISEEQFKIIGGIVTLIFIEHKREIYLNDYLIQKIKENGIEYTFSDGLNVRLVGKKD